MATNKNQKLLPAYLVVGEDKLKRRVVVDRLRKRAAQFGEIEFNYDEFDIEHAKASDVIEACNTMPFASDIRLVIVRNIDKLNKKNRDALTEYLKNPADFTVLLLDGAKLAKTTALYKTIKKIDAKAVIDCTPPNKKGLVDDVRSIAVAHGAPIAPAAAELLIASVGEDTIRLDSELKKLALAHMGNDPISTHEVREMVPRTALLKYWDLIDAISNRNILRCLEVFPLVDSTPYGLIAQATKRIRELIAVKALTARGEVGLVPQAIGLTPNRKWLVKNYDRWARNYSGEELRDALISARDAEKAMKTGTDPHEAFYVWMINVVLRK